MQLLESIQIQQATKTAEVQLFRGDLSDIPPEQKVDILVVSAFPDSYVALPGSLVLALEEKGLSLEELAGDKLEDLRPQLGCWFSRPLPAALQQKLNFKQVLCFEPATQSTNATEVVGNIFRCLNNYVFDDSVASVAIPVIATGYQNVPFEKMFPVLIDTAVFWLKQGLPLRSIKIVIREERFIEPAVAVFKSVLEKLRLASAKQSLVPDEFVFTDTIKPAAAPEIQFGQDMRSVIKPQTISPGDEDTQLDYFISYSHTQSNMIQHFVEALLKIRPGLRIFYDKDSIAAGGLWIRQISDAITKAGKVLIFMSPDYSASMICWDEFQCAKLKEYNLKKPVIQTIYLTSDPALPPIMGIHSYIDCREGDLDKLAIACEQLLK